MKTLIAVLLLAASTCFGQDDPVPPLTVVHVHGGSINVALVVAPQAESVSMGIARASWLNAIHVALSNPPWGTISVSLVTGQDRLSVKGRSVSEIQRWVTVNDWLNAKPANVRNWVSGAKAEITEAIQRDGYTPEILERAENLKQ